MLHPYLLQLFDVDRQIMQLAFELPNLLVLLEDVDVQTH